MTKGLEALENIKSLFVGSPINLSRQFDIIEKELKALEIIKNKEVDIKWRGGLPPLLQNTYGITDEEYELLKEVLENE